MIHILFTFFPSTMQPFSGLPIRIEIEYNINTECTCHIRPPALVSINYILCIKKEIYFPVYKCF
uniref:Uncharacterized protein n=1 Tax=Anguilla anguilla TaxID=7936 RepID=A0A0E9RCZ7_ANGAN